MIERILDFFRERRRLKICKKCEHVKKRGHYFVCDHESGNRFIGYVIQGEHRCLLNKFNERKRE